MPQPRPAGANNVAGVFAPFAEIAITAAEVEPPQLTVRHDSEHSLFSRRDVLGLCPSAADHTVRTGLKPVYAVFLAEFHPKHVAGSVDGHQRDVVQTDLSGRIHADRDTKELIPSGIDPRARSVKPA